MQRWAAMSDKLLASSPGLTGFVCRAFHLDADPNGYSASLSV